VWERSNKRMSEPDMDILFPLEVTSTDTPLLPIMSGCEPVQFGPLVYILVLFL
jgi:hypothetical protein